jgi:hypothetical protein
MRFFTLPALLAAALFSAAIVQPWLPSARHHGDAFALEARVSSTRAGHVQVYPDTGEGLSELTAVRAPIEAGSLPVKLRFDFPSGDYRAFRFDPLNRDGTVTIEDARFIAKNGRVVREILPSEWQAVTQISGLRVEGTRLTVSIPIGSNDPQLSISFAPFLGLHESPQEWLEDFLNRWLSVLAGLALLLFALDRLPPRVREKISAVRAWTGATPRRAIAIAALVAVVASAYPVVFLGKSFVSPDLGAVLLYDDYPTLPGYKTDHVADVKGSDIGAIAWQDIPFTVTQRNALLKGELPLWNRYNSCGTPLLGQGQSMFGDPLHFIPMVANSASWAWDLKYLLAKFLFAFGLGLSVLLVARHLPAAVLTAAAAPFIGFFVYRINHPAFFSLCYAPWVLVTWLNFIETKTRRDAAGWLAGLMLANWSLLNSGTAKEAYMLLLCLNLGGVVMLLTAMQPWRERLLRLAGAAWAGVLFTLLALPGLTTFFVSLAVSYTSYNTPSAFQIQAELLLGFFDEVFYRPLSQNEMLFNPALNLLLLGGVLYFLATLRENFSLRRAMALGITALLPLSLAFGFVPSRWIVLVPFLANVAHIDNTFSCVLIVFTIVLAGVGFRRALERLGTPAGRGDLAAAALMLFALVFAYVSFTQAVHRSVFGYGTTFTFMKAGEALPVKPFIWNYLIVAVVALSVGAITLRRALAAENFSPATCFILLTCVLALVWRNGFQANSGFESYVVNPTARVNLHARSDAMQFMRAAVAREPVRGVGLQGNYFPGWSGFYGLESIAGPDALINPRYRELTEASGMERIWDWRYYLTIDSVPNARPILDAFNVRFYFDYKSDQGRDGAVLKLVRATDLDVYESATVWPRAFFTDHIVSYENAPDLIAKIRAGDGRPFAAAQAPDLAGDQALKALPHGLDGRTVTPATNYQFTENTATFTVRASGPGVALLTEAYLPGNFRAEVDGQRAPIVRLNHAFKGVLLATAGEHRVSFRYQPRRFFPSLLAAGSGVILFAGSFWLARRKPPAA